MTVETRLENTTLYFRQGSSDKVYQASIEKATGGYVVNFAYGRRGNTLQTGTKTNVAVSAAEAERIYHKLVAEKMAKGYTEGADGTPYQNTEKETRASGLLPQLLNPVDETEAERLINDDEWGMQEKKNGCRLLLRKEVCVGGAIAGINRKGLIVALPETVAENAHDIEGDFVIDGEIVGDTLYVFDMLAANGENIQQTGYHRRYNALLNLLNRRGLPPYIRPLPCWLTATSKANAFRLLKKANAEGVVFKKLDAPYTAGCPASGGTQLKHKFYATLSAVVDGVSTGKRSVSLRLLPASPAIISAPDGWIRVGRVTISPNHSIPKVGAVAEIRYLYAYPNGCLYQPVYLGERADIDPEECLTSQLKLKPDDDEDESQ